MFVIFINSRNNVYEKLSGFFHDILETFLSFLLKSTLNALFLFNN